MQSVIEAVGLIQVSLMSHYLYYYFFFTLFIIDSVKCIVGCNPIQHIFKTLLFCMSASCTLTQAVETEGAVVEEEADVACPG